MAKYGDGLGIEFVRAVKKGFIKQPFTTQDVKWFAQYKGWDVPDHYVNVLLANGSSENHSLTYKKYFKPCGNGGYELSDLALNSVL